jgi:hypothetical protein
MATQHINHINSSLACKEEGSFVLSTIWPESKEDLEFYENFHKLPILNLAEIRKQRALSYKAYQNQAK